MRENVFARLYIKKTRERKHCANLALKFVVGDLLDLDQVKAAMEGVTGAYSCTRSSQGLIDAAAFFAQAAIEAGVKSIVNMSQKPARR